MELLALHKIHVPSREVRVCLEHLRGDHLDEEVVITKKFQRSGTALGIEEVEALIEDLLTTLESMMLYGSFAMQGTKGTRSKDPKTGIGGRY